MAMNDMRNRMLLVGLFGCGLLGWESMPPLCSASEPGAAPVITVTPSVTTPEPVSPLLFSGFIELAFGRSENVLAEMLFDRGFEVPDTLTFNKGWCSFTKPKPEMEEWWHSGYEENRWYLWKAESDTASEMKRLGGGYWPAPANGKVYVAVTNKSRTDPVCLAQNGIWVKPGLAHSFTGFFCDGTHFSADRKARNPVNLEICLFPERKFDGPALSSVTLKVDTAVFERYTATLPACKYEGRATFAIRVGPGKRFSCDMLSLMPADHAAGLRKDVIEAMKQVPASVVRFPGGCFASFYSWRDGIGDRDVRPVNQDTFWENVLINDFGTVEFVRLCREIGAEPMLCVPVMFGDAENAADWVAFCNAPRHPLHRKAGLDKPLGVKYWEMDNETYRLMDAITYARRCVEFSRAMKRVDPSIKIIMNCYWNYHPKLQEMLDIAGADVDLVNNRGGKIAELRGDIAALADYNRKHNRDVPLCHSEYRANSYDLPVAKPAAGGADGLNQPSSDAKETILTKASRWAYGLSVLCDFLDYQSFGGAFRFANFTNYTDGWGENLVNCSKSKAYLSAAGQAYAFLQRQKMAWPLAIEVPDSAPTLRFQAAWNGDKTTLILVVLNMSAETRTLTADLSRLDRRFAKEASGEALSAASPLVFNTETEPNRIARETFAVPNKGKRLTHPFKPWSATAIRLGSE